MFHMIWFAPKVADVQHFPNDLICSKKASKKLDTQVMIDKCSRKTDNHNIQYITIQLSGDTGIQITENQEFFCDSFIFTLLCE